MYILPDCCYSVTESCLTLCNPMNCSMPGFPPSLISQNLLKLRSIALVMPSNHLILCHPLFLLPSFFVSIKVFSNESPLCIRWAKYWSFRISPSNEYVLADTSAQVRHSVMSDSLQPHGLQHARLPCLLPTPGACLNSYPSSW